MRKRQLATGAIFMGALALGGWLAAQAWLPAARAEPTGRPITYSLKGRYLMVHTGPTTAVQRTLPCAGSSLLRHGKRLYVGCGAQGMVVLSLAAPAAPAALAHRTFAGSVVGFFVQEGRVWVKIAKLEARPVGEVAPPPAHAPAPVETPRPPTVAPPRVSPETSIDTRAVGRVLSGKMGVVVIDIGARHGLRRGHRIRFFQRKKVQMDATETAEREHLIAVGTVTAVSATRAQVRLGTNEHVPVGASAERTRARLTSSLLAPPRVGGGWTVKFMVRPIIPVGNAGFGTQLDAWLTYRFPFPMAVHLVIDPFGFAVGKGEDGVAMAGQAILAADLRLFEIGLGVGATTSNSDEGTEPVFALNQYIRLGALDGFHFEVHNALTFKDKEFQYAGTTGGFQIPVGERWWILLRGGWRDAGYWFGEAGLRVRLRGNGGPGTVFLSATVGAASVFDRKPAIQDPACTPWCGSREVEYLGPMAGVGLEWRP